MGAYTKVVLRHGRTELADDSGTGPGVCRTELTDVLGTGNTPV